MGRITTIDRTRKVFRFHVFVAHQRLDSESAIRLTHALQKPGIRIWLDIDSGAHDKALSFRARNDLRGQSFPASASDVTRILEQAIDFAVIVAVVTSQNTLQSIWVQEEIKIACRAGTPLFFWHVAAPVDEQVISVRGNGSPAEPQASADAFVEAVADKYVTDRLASNASSVFMETLGGHAELNIVGHKITALDEVDAVASQINTLVEMSELVLHKRQPVTVESLEQVWHEYSALKDEAVTLQKAIQEKYGRLIGAGRVPAFPEFNFERPFVVSRVKHLQRILKDRLFAVSQIRKLDIQKQLNADTFFTTSGKKGPQDEG